MLDKDYLIKGEMYQYNLGWLIQELMNFKSDLATAIDLKTIKYADPIQWDITTQYAANTVVIDPKTGTAYMSKAPVPSGVLLDNTNYWVVVFNYQKIYNDIMSGIASNEEDSDYATKEYAVFDLVWYAGKLYRVTKPITEGAKFIIGTNLETITVEAVLNHYKGSDRTSDLVNDTVTASGTVKVDAANLVTDISGDLTVTAGDLTENLTHKVETVTGDLQTEVSGGVNLKVGSAAFETSSNSWPIKFPGKTVDLAEISKQSYWFSNRKIVCYGDSTASNANSYINLLISKYGADITNRAEGGTSLVNKYQEIINADTTAFDTIIINFGINDWQASAAFYRTYANTDMGYGDCLDTLLNALTAKNKLVYVILPWFCWSYHFSNGTINNTFQTLAGQNDAAIDICTKYGVPYTNLYTLAGINAQNYKALMEDSGNIYVHGLDYINGVVADLLAAGAFNNGKCYDVPYKIMTPLFGNGFANKAAIDTALKPTSIKQQGYNIKVSGANNAVVTGAIRGGETIRISGYLVGDGVNAIAIYDLTTSEFKSIAYISKAAYSYTKGFFSLTFDAPGSDLYYIAFQHGTDDFFILGLQIESTKPCKVIGDNDGQPPLTLTNGTLNDYCYDKDGVWVDLTLTDTTAYTQVGEAIKPPIHNMGAATYNNGLAIYVSKGILPTETQTTSEFPRFFIPLSIS